MSQLQKIIKSLAIAFALFLLFSIISGIMYGVSFLGNLLDDNSQNITEKLDNLEINEDILLLDIKVLNSNIVIKQGDSYKVETNNKYIKSKQEGNKLYITEKKHNWFYHNENNKLVVYVPAGIIFDGVGIESGAGKVNIDDLSVKQLYLDLGAGKVEINHLTVSENAEMDGGAGEIIVRSSHIHNLDLDVGVGNVSFTSKLTGNNKINAGVGQMDLSLLGELNDYHIMLDKGLGSAIIDGKNMISNTIYGTGSNNLDIDGGVGSIHINFIEER